MKTIDTTKGTVLIIGSLAILASIFGAIKDLNVTYYLFGMYVGLILIGSTLLHKEEKVNTIK